MREGHVLQPGTGVVAAGLTGASVGR
jgi:hypothetical protein